MLRMQQIKDGDGDPDKNPARLRRAYQCPHCGLFHLTSMKNIEQKTVEQKRKDREAAFPNDKYSSTAMLFAKRNGWKMSDERRNKSKRQ